MKILDKLHDLNRITGQDYEITLKADGSGALSRAFFPFKEEFRFSSLQDLSKQIYRIILNAEK